MISTPVHSAAQAVASRAVPRGSSVAQLRFHDSAFMAYNAGTINGCGTAFWHGNRRMTLDPQVHLDGFVEGFTIDGPTSKDLDDAIFVERDGDGWVVHVSIADVASTVALDDRRDQQARELGQTHYGKTGIRPMFSRHLSEGRLSLLPGKRRSVMAISIPLSSGFDIGPAGIARKTLVSRERFSYEQVDAILKEGGHELAELLTQCRRIAQGLLEKRRAAGAFLIYDIFSGWATTEEGAIRRLGRDERFMGNVIVQQFMILANEAVARFLLSRQMPALFRNHTATPATPSRASLVRDFDAIVSNPDETRISTLQERVAMVLNKATYGPKLEGHYGLNLPAYVHCTSPIRRYADLVTQRIVFAAIAGDQPPYFYEDLEQIGTALTEKDWERKRLRQEAMREKRHDRTREQIIKDEVAGLDPAEFHRIVKMAVCENLMTPALADELIERAAADRIEPRDACFVLLGTDADTEDWVRAKEQTLHWLVAHPYHAQTVLVMASQNELCTEPEFTMSSDPDAPDHHRLFTATCSMRMGEFEYTSGSPTKRSKKDAQQAAAVDLVVGIVCDETGLSPEAFSVPDEPLVDEGAREEPPADSDVNYKGRLLERCSQRRWAAPVFTSTQEGESHRPTITAVVRIKVLGVTYESQAVASSKKQAERMAARDLLEQLTGSADAPADPASTSKPAAPVDNFVAALQEWCVQKGHPHPDYQFTLDGPSHEPVVTCTCIIELGEDGRVSEVGTHGNKKAAKQAAARAAYNVVTQNQSS